MRRGIRDDERATVKVMCALFLLLVFCVVGFTSPASGEERLGTYLELKGGIYSPSATFNLKDVSLETTFKASTRTGVDGEVAIGHYFLPTLALELGVGYFKGKGSFGITPAYSMDFNVVPLILSAKALIPVGPVDPYGEAGIGAYFTRFDAAANGSNFSGSSTLGFHFGVGVNVNISPRVFVGAEGRYVTANPSIGDQKIRLNDTDYALNGFKLNGFTTTLGLGFSF